MIPKVYLLVEGQTEEAFVTQVLQPYFGLSLYLYPIVVTTRPVPDGPDFKGGYVTYPELEKQLRILLRDSSAACVTMMHDLYAWPQDSPGMNSAGHLVGRAKALHLERALASQFNTPRFHPYLQVHEYETLLFVDVDTTCSVLGGSNSQLQRLRAIRKAVSSPEEIDDGPTTAPSKRIRRLFAGYQKVLHGPQVAGRVGVDDIRLCCEHFREWLSRLENISRG